MTKRFSFCIKAATTLADQDLNTVTTAIEAYVKGGMSTQAAEAAAVGDALKAIQTERAELKDAIRAQHPGRFKKAADATAPVQADSAASVPVAVAPASDQQVPTPATHKDPGEPAEPATPAVVAEAIKTAAKVEDRKPSEMKAELLAKVDAAVTEAADYDDFQIAVKSMGEADAVATFTDAKGTLGATSAPNGYSRPTRTFKIEGDGTFTVNNTVRQLLLFRAKVKASKGFVDKPTRASLTERATDTLDRRSTDAAIAAMIDEGDMQAATDFAEFKGVKLADVKLTQVLRGRLDKWQRDQKMAADTAAFLAKPPAPLDLMKDGLAGREVPWSTVPTGSDAFQYAIGVTEEDGQQAIYRRRADERGSYGGWRWEADAPKDEQQPAPQPAPKPEPDAPVAEGVASQTFDQWARASYAANEYAAKYLEEFDGNENRATLASVVGTIDTDRTTAELLKAAKQEYRKALFDLPREISISLDVWDDLNDMLKVEAQRHFYDLDARITKRDQAAYAIKAKTEAAKKAPYEAAFAEVDAEIRRLDKISGPETQKQKDLSARRERLRQAIYQIGQGKEPDGRLLPAATPPPQQPEAAEPAAQPEAQAGPATPSAAEKAEAAAPSRPASTGRMTDIRVPDETTRWMGFAGARTVRADLVALAQRHPEYYDSPQQVASDIEFVLGRPDGWYIHKDSRVVLFRERVGSGAIPQARVEVEADADTMNVRSVYVGGKRQVAKKMADKRGVIGGLELGGQSPDSLTIAEYLKALGRGSSRPASPSGETLKAKTTVAPQPDGGKPVAQDAAPAETPTPAATEIPPAAESPKARRERRIADKAESKTPTVDAHHDLFKAVRAGTATPEAFKAMYASVRDGKDAITAELNTSTKEELLKGISGAYIRPGTTKGELVEAIYKGLLNRFALGKDYGPSGYMMGQEKAYKKAKRDAFDALVEGQMAESLAEYAAALKAEFDAAMTARAARLESIKDPKSLSDFRAFTTYHMSEGKTEREIRFMLTPEQRALVDELFAAETRGKRTTAKDEQRTAVRVAGQTVDGDIIATKHTKKGTDLFVVKLAERVSREDYDTLNTGAKRIGGGYSSFRGAGAIPGFQFTTREQAQAFVTLAGGDNTAAVAAAQERRDSFVDDRSQSAVERLTEMADRLDERADESLGRERKANTARRAGFAASAEATAQSDKALAKTMRNIADAITGGTAKFLDRVRQKAQVEMLQGYVRTAKDAELRAKHDSYTEQERHKGEPPTGETADYAEFPTFTAYRSDLASLGRQLLEVDGTKRLGEQIMKVADDVSDAYLAFAKENFFKVGAFSSKGGGVASFGTRDAAEAAIKRSGYKGKAIAYQVKRGEHTVIMSPSEAIARNIWKGDGDKRITLTPDFGAELVEKIGRANRRGARVSVPWQFESAHDRRKALARMGIETSAEFRAALREFIGLREQAAAPDKVKQMERAMIGRRNDGLDFFPTPEETADAMIDAADIQPGMRVLEPSAGMGHIAERIRAAEVEPDVGEFANDRRELLEAKGFNVVAQDFLALKEGGYDRILMNPPFSDGRDIQHVRHAYGLLKPGGRLVALMGESAFTNQNKRATEFREWLDSVGGTEEKLAEGTFNDPSLPVNTGANARMVVIDAGNVAMFNTAEDGYTADDGTEFAADATPDGARNIGLLDGAVSRTERGAGADSVHPYVARSLRTDAPLRTVADAFGRRVQWFDLRDDLAPAQRRKFGFFNGAKLGNTIFLRSRGNDRPHLAVLGHELGHRLKNERPDLYANLIAAITPFVDVKRYEADFKQTAVARDVKTEDGIQEEFVGEILSDGFMDPQFWRAVGNKNPALLARVVGFIGDLIQSIKAKVGYAKRTERFLSDYDRVMQIAGGVMAEFGVQPDTNNDIKFQTADTLLGAVTRQAKAVADLELYSGRKVIDFIESHGKLSWWDKSVGTPYNLAKRYPNTFGRFYDATQAFLSDVSYLANEAANLAPTLLPKLEAWGDIFKSPISAADNKAIAASIFEGTLTWTRDKSGKPVKMDLAEAAAAKLSAEDKATEMLRLRRIHPNVLKMWRGLPLEQFEKAIETRYESEMLKSGVVWSDAELKSIFNLTPPKIALYREFRAGTDKSLNDLTISEMLRLGGKDVAGMTDAVRAMTHTEASEALSERLNELAAENPDRSKVFDDTADKIIVLSNRTKDLTDRGYAPLSRFGQYTLDVVDGGERVYFGLFETQRDANLMARKMREQFPDAKISSGTQSQEEYKQFAGVSPETVELFGEMLGLDSTGNSAADQAFQAYLKKATATRSAMKRLIHRKGIAGFSEDAGRVLAGFITSNARRGAGSLHFKEMADAAADIPKGQGELKDYAVRMDEYVRNPIEEAQKFRGLLFAQYLGGSVASALVNMTQPVTVTFPYLSQFGGARRAASGLKAAYNDMAFGKTLAPDLEKALKKAEEDGIVAPQEIFHLYAQSQGAGALRPGDGTKSGDAMAKANNAVAKLALGWGKLFSFGEMVNRRVTFIAAYRIAQGRGEADPAAFAAKAVIETQFSYNRGNKPEWARGAIGGVLFTFKTFSIAMTEMLVRLYKSGPEGKKAAMLAMAMLLLVGGADGLPFMEDAEDLVDGFMQRVMGRNWSTKQKRNEIIASIVGDDVGAFLQNGISGIPGVPIDVSGRLGMGNLIPGTGLFRKDANGQREVEQIAGPGYDFIKRSFTAAGLLAQGEVTKAGIEIAPKAVQNVAKAADMARMGAYRDAKGNKVIDTTLGEVALKATGFQPSSVAKVQESSGQVVRMIALNKINESEIAAQWAQGMYENDQDKVRAARDRLAQWNKSNPESPMQINMRQIRQRVAAMRETKAQRIERTSPKEIRMTVKRELAGA